jgi:hypothetical protein
MKLASFDLEIASVVPFADLDWSKRAGLGISCAAVAVAGVEEARIWQGRPRLERQDSIDLVERLSELSKQGYLLTTWNGCSFDFRVLAEDSGMNRECGELALNHVDLMVMVTFTKGWYLSLQAALEGAGLSGKLKTVQLSDGSLVKDMGASKAPELWAAGEYEAVLEYLKRDVLQLLKLAHSVADLRTIRWTSRAGKPQEVRFPRLLTVSECFAIPEPDTSWMSDPPKRQQFVEWIGRLPA